MTEKEVTLVDMKIPPELWDRIFNKKAKHMAVGVTPNWIFFSKLLAHEVPEIKEWKIVSSMRVHICILPDGVDILMVRLYDD